LKIYGISLLKYHISFENSGLKLNLIVFKYINELSTQKLFNYLKEDIASINNPFISVTGIEKLAANVIDTKFLSYKRPFNKLRILGLRRDSRKLNPTIGHT